MNKTKSPKPKKYKRKPVERIRDRTRISELYLNNYDQEEIAEKLGISQSTVSRETKLLQSKWEERSVQSIETWKAQELAYLQKKRQELEEIWKLSQNRLNIIKTKRATMIQGVVTAQEISEREELILADTKIGDLLLDVSDKIAALTGIEAPKRSELTGAGGAPLNPPAEIETVRTVIKDD